jgi:hypothetical protein
MATSPVLDEAGAGLGHVVRGAAGEAQTGGLVAQRLLQPHLRVVLQHPLGALHRHRRPEGDLHGW